MKRKDAIALAKIAGYHDDEKAIIRLRVENRISYSVLQEAYLQGARKRAKGMPCTCSDCKAGTV